MQFCAREKNWSWRHCDCFITLVSTPEAYISIDSLFNGPKLLATILFLSYHICIILHTNDLAIWINLIIYSPTKLRKRKLKYGDLHCAVRCGIWSKRKNEDLLLSKLRQHFNIADYTEVPLLLLSILQTTNLSSSRLILTRYLSSFLNAVGLVKASNAVTSMLSPPPTLLLSGEYFCNGRCPHWLLKEDTVLLGVVIQHSWHAHNRLWHNVKSSQPNVRGSHFQQIESGVQLEKVKLWLITVCEYRWRGWSGIVGSSQSSHQFSFKWNFFFFFSKLFFSSLHVLVSEGMCLLMQGSVWYYSVTLSSGYHFHWSVCAGRT